MTSESSTVEISSADRSGFALVSGDCRIEVDLDEPITYRGHVLVVAKPDGTLLVHDTQGYQPVAWLTRADQVTMDADEGTITAVDGDRWLRIQVISSILDRELPGTAAGIPVAECPACDGQLIEGDAAVHCINCRNEFGIPSDAVVLESRCTCGLPQMRIERGDVFDLCIDRTCQPMDEAIADRFDGMWACPDDDCTGTMHVIRRRNLLVACAEYPDCDVAFRFPPGPIDGHCGCGLPRFAVNGESRCLDGQCATNP